ncbi:hypothetical protein PV326_011251 [Microctonus aethiopoides]|nr:hypothetical protein PV326_011251 [Microctonus aethiopoides]
MNVYRMMFSLMFIVLFISLNLENVKAINWKAVDLLWKRPRRAVTEKIPKYSEDCATAPISDDQSQSDSKHVGLSSSSPTSPTLISKKRTLDTGGNPSELAWQAWLLFDNEGESDTKNPSDSANVMRRITPKSIFIAPPLITCPDGYEPDYMDRCTKTIQIDEDAHLNFILERLNAMYAHLGKPESTPSPEPSPLSPPPSSSSSSSSSSSETTGPIQFNIPLIIETVNDDTPKLENVDTKKPEEPLLTFTPHLNENIKNKPMTSNNEDTIVTVYEVKDTKRDKEHEEKDEKIFIIENDSAKVNNNDENDSINDEKIVPIVEFVQETNSNITDIIDYNIPIISISEIQNRSEFTNINHDSHNDKQSTLVLFLTPSNFSTSNTNENSAPGNNTTNDRVSIAVINNTSDSTAKQNVSVNLPPNTVTYLTPIEGFSNDSESTNGSLDVEITTTLPNNESGVTEEVDETTDYLIEDEEESDDTTGYIEEDFYTSTESDEEILTHSEAGLSVTLPAIHLQPLSQSSNKNKNTTPSKISSEVAISDDFNRETTLLSLNGNQPVIISKDTVINDNITSINSTKDEKVVVVTPISDIVIKTTLPSKEIVSIINLNTEENTESSKIIEEITTENSDDDFSTKTVYLSTTQIDEIPSTNSDNINPVLSIEEASVDEEINQQQPPPLIMEALKMVSPNNANENQEQIDLEESDKFKIITTSSANTTKIIIPRDKPQEVTSLTPIMNDDTQSTKHIRASSPIIFENKKKNLSSSISVNKNEGTYNYDTNSQHVSTSQHHTYGFDNNQPIIETINNQKLESNKNHDYRKNFFPNNFPISYDSIRNYVRFPTNKRPHTESGLVRFPSNDANSIHTPNNLKERYDHRPYASQSNRGSTRTETVTLTQSNRSTPSYWRSDHNHHHHHNHHPNHQESLPQISGSTTNEQRPRESSPLLMKFWANVPLLKDPSLLYHPTYATVIAVDPAKQHNVAHSQPSVPVKFYNKMPTVDQTRIFNN